MAEVDSGWDQWRGNVTATLRALEEGQARIENALIDRDGRISGRIGKVEDAISGVHKRIDEVENGVNHKFIAGLGTAVLALAGWVATLLFGSK